MRPHSSHVNWLRTELRTQVKYMGIYYCPLICYVSNPGPQRRTLTSVRVSLVWHTIAPLHQLCTIALVSTGTCNYPVGAPQLHPLQLLLPECIRFKLLVPDCVRFSGCSPIVPTSALLPDCIHFKLLSPIAFTSALLPDCTHFSKQLLSEIYASNIFSAF